MSLSATETITAEIPISKKYPTEQFTKADQLAVMLCAVEEKRNVQKDMPAGVGGLLPPFYFLLITVDLMNIFKSYEQPVMKLYKKL